jgi:hypothetical protein
MNQINFILTGMTFLRYYVPLAIAAKKRSIRSSFYVSRSNKYNCPSRFTEKLDLLREQYEIGFYPIEEIQRDTNPIITVEGDGIQFWNNRSRVFSINFCTDYIVSYKTYLDKIDSLFLPSELFKSKIDKDRQQNVSCLGTPKFDISIDQAEVRKKYDLNDQKYVTLFYPRSRDLSNFPIQEVVKKLNDLGYSVLVKSRLKDPVSLDVGTKNRVFYDTDWYPHTSMELIAVSDFIVNTSSMSIEESICMLKPTLNFDVKPFDQTFPELFENDTNINRVKYDQHRFESDIENIITMSLDKDSLINVRNKFFNNVGNTSEKILDMIT